MSCIVVVVVDHALAKMSFGTCIQLSFMSDLK